jgi:hypothetical protein
MEIGEKLATSLSKKILFTKHAVNEMLDESEIIETKEIVEVLKNGKIIEDYPEDRRGHSCLVSGITFKERTIHVVCAPGVDYLAIITVYEPDKNKWSDDFERRK